MRADDSSDGSRNHVFLIRTILGINQPINWILGSILLSVFIDVIANVMTPILPKDVEQYLQTISNWAFENRIAAILILLILLLFKYMYFLVKDVPLPPSHRVLKQDYLESLVTRTRDLVPEGLPAHIRGLSASMDTVFFSPYFYANALIVDHQLKDTSSENEYRWPDLPFNESSRITFSSIWKNFNRQRSIAVIHGYPGMGKSTLLIGLTLHMAQLGINRWYYILARILNKLSLNPLRSFSLSEKVEGGLHVFDYVYPPLVPILLYLRDYASYIELNDQANLFDFIKHNWSNHYSFLSASLSSGKCIVLFDGLDEVKSDLRSRVQADINMFVRDCSKNHFLSFNRFIITSRPACFDHNAFPDVNSSFYTIAYLTLDEIRKLLSDYFSAFEFYHPQFENKQREIIEEAEKRATKLSEDIKSNKPIADLAKNPLLLYLLVVILFQKNIDDSILQKIDLYMMATKLLLEGQSGSRKLSPIKETVAINILGKIATRMQENGSWVIHNEEVIQLLRASMAFKDDREVERFLRLIRERSGLFFRGRGNKYGFYHPTFQDYFAARYLVRDVKRKQTRSRRINQLIEKGCDLDNKWREPFILAVAYLSREDGEGVGIVNEILKKVLERASNESDKKAQESILLLAAECVIEVQPLHIDNLLMDSIVQQIKIIFTDINKDQEVERHQQITDLSHRWKRICKQDLLDP